MKRGFFIWLCFLFGILLSIGDAFALGVMYWHDSNINFEPGMTIKLDYFVHGVYSNQEIRVYVTGDLSQYVEISPEKITGDGAFTAIIKLPETIEVPGPHRLYFIAEEIPQSAGGVGTSVTIRVPYTIHVPYPGKYATASLTVEDVNVGEPLQFNIEGVNLGTEDNTIAADLSIYLGGEKIGGFYLGSILVEKQEKFYFSKRVDTRDYKPGDYKAVAIIDYGSPLKLETDFRIGSLFVSITNYTSRFMKDSINKFDIGVESRWNNLIDELYGEVRIYNESSNISIFKTPSESLERWGMKSLSGFFDTRGIGSGLYKAEINVFYTSGKKSAQTTKTINIEVAVSWWEKYKMILITAVFIGILLILSLAFFGYLLINRLKKKKK